MKSIGILHPGEMGISIAASAKENGHRVYWVSESRSAKTRSRAEQFGLIDSGSLAQVCRDSEIILSICPPHAAEDVARSISEQGFAGVFVDANAISPRRAIQIGQIMKRNGSRFVDGGIIGGPAWTPNETWLYLSGADAQEVAGCFSNGPVGVRVIDMEIGKASALKMCYAAYSKGTTALLAAILAVAESLGVRDDLYRQWEEDEAGFVKQAEGRTRRVTAKAWRFEGEMLEIASTFREAGLPDGFHEAASDVYHRMAGLKDRSVSPPLDEVLAALSGKY